MSTSYFILSKPSNSKVDNKSQDQIYILNTLQTYILPTTNIQYYLNHGLFESNLIEWCKQFCNPNKTFIDIGSHSGTYSVALAPFSKDVYAFEPQRMTYYSLCGSIALSRLENVYCENYGLGDDSQTGILNLKIVSNDGGGSSLLATTGVLREESVIIKTLDSYNLDNIGFIKIDVEGNELSVICGSKNTLIRNNLPTILFESNNKDKLLMDEITSLGYKIRQVNGYSNMFLASS